MLQDPTAPPPPGFFFLGGGGWLLPAPASSAAHHPGHGEGHWSAPPDRGQTPVTPPPPPKACPSLEWDAGPSSVLMSAGSGDTTRLLPGLRPLNPPGEHRGRLRAPLKAVCRDTWEKGTFHRLPLGSRIERGVPVPAPHPAPGLAVGDHRSSDWVRFGQYFVSVLF